MNKNQVHNRKLGAEKEHLAMVYLKQQGMQILHKNFRARNGEIDLIGLDKEYLVFVEVKYRKNNVMGSAKAAVTLAKQVKICHTANYYRYLYHIPQETNIRYDVVAIQGEQIEWVKNAFEHIFW